MTSCWRVPMICSWPAPAAPPDGEHPPEKVEVPGYEILEELGRGGMGVVYNARQLALNRLVALKMILSADLASPEQLVRFRHEAELAAQIQHANVVQVHEVGAWRGRPYLALEWVEGGTLSDWLRCHAVSPREAAHLVEQLARGIGAAHEKGSSTAT
jgi:serine/threonine protein kinase